MSTQKVFIGIPAYGGMNGSSFRSCLGLMVQLMNRRIEHTFYVAENLGDIVRVRNNILAKFLASDMTHILMVDADIGFPPESVIHMLEADRPFIGAAIPLRRQHWSGVEKFVADYDDISAQSLAAHSVQFNIEPETTTAHGAFIPVKGMGVAFALISREAIERMAAAYPELEYVDEDGNSQTGLFNHMVDPDTRQMLGEDISFCRRWRDLSPDNAIQCLTDCSVTHMGPILLKGNLKDVSDDIGSYTQKPKVVS